MHERIVDQGVATGSIGEVDHGAFANPDMLAILKEFGRGAFGRASTCFEFESFLRRLGVRGGTCLEIGTFHGVSAVILSRYFEKVLSVSVDDSPENLLKHKIVSYLGIENVAFYDAKDNAEKKSIVDSLAFDFAYVDGDHARDTESDFALVERCGRVLFHEFWPLQPPVWNLVNRLPPDEVRFAEHDCLAYWERTV